MDGILTGLNTAQRTAVTSEASVLQVLAPPGSGKTKTLTARVAYFIAHRQLKPWNIIVCTFTVKAAREMQERIRGFVGDQVAKKLKIGTFHGIALRYLRQYGKHKAIVKRIIAQAQSELDPAAARSRISTQKSKGVSAEQFTSTVSKNVEQRDFSQVFSLYQAQLKACNLLDYDDLLLVCVQLLRSHPECVANVEALLVDEFQDTNGVQYELMSLLAQRRNVITIVGDPDQSIYGWRSAEIKNLGRMKEQWSDTLTVNLEENYRSSGAILHAAQMIIEQDESRPPKKLQATHTIGQRPVLRKLPQARHEADWLTAEIKRMRALTGNMLELSDFAVLLRSAALSRPIETSLGAAGMPYRMIGGMKFYDRVEVKMLLDYLRVIDQPSHNEALARVINAPSRKVGDKTVEVLQREASNKGISLWTLILGFAQGRTKVTTNLNAPAQRGIEQFVNVILTLQKKLAADPSGLYELFAQLQKMIGLQEHLKTKYPDDHETRWSNVEELMALAIDAQVQASTEGHREEEVDGPALGDGAVDESALTAFLANAALAASIDEKVVAEGEKVHQVTISTIHAAKGLEWPVVFIPACYEGSIPHSRADDNDEERRLLYVGMTRAQAMLYLSCPGKSTRQEDTTMSSFLEQPGVSSFFEEHGPSISHAEVQSLAVTLQRCCPDIAAIAATAAALDLQEDNYWPLTGELPFTEASWQEGAHQSSAMPVFGNARSASWANSTTNPGEPSTLGFGFTSVKDRFQSLMEEQEEKQTLRLDRLAGKHQDGQGPKGKKRQIEGQGSIATFFGKKPKMVEEAQPTMMPESELPVSLPPYARPLRDISNLNPEPIRWTKPAGKPASLLAHKPRTAPLYKRQPATHEGVRQSASVSESLTSSSVAVSTGHLNESEIDADPRPAPPNTTPAALPPFRPPASLHTTSMQAVAARGPTLGMRRSMQGWGSRGGKR
ncbi:ATP-dependent DNA helicase srs2 [Oleoguttula sp. CCFEE 5521]